MQVEYQVWDGQRRSAHRLLDLLAVSVPIINPLNRNSPETFLEFKRKGFEAGTLVAKVDEQIQGFVTIEKGPRSDEVRMAGCVHPDYRCRGIANELWLRTQSFLNEKHITTVRSSAFETQPAGATFLYSLGFSSLEVVYWSDRPVSQPFSECVLAKVKAFEKRNLQVVRGDEFALLREDWDLAWWTLTNDTARDIPSREPFRVIPFEEWQMFMAPPHTDRSLTLLALDGIEPVGLLSLGKLLDGKMNINYTGVQKRHRRGGVSLALKVEATKLAKRMGAKVLTTQNHEENPMLKLNRSLGFHQVDACVVFERKL